MLSDLAFSGKRSGNGEAFLILELKGVLLQGSRERKIAIEMRNCSIKLTFTAYSRTKVCAQSY